MKEKWLFYVVSSLFIVVGIVFVIVSFFIRKEATYFIKEGIKTEAVITSISKKQSGDSVRYEVLVSYQIEGITYHQNLGYYQRGMKEIKSFLLDI